MFKPMDIAPLIFYRISFGTIMLIEVMRYFNYGWIERYWMEPIFYFTYDGFHWLAPWPGEGMKYHFMVMAVLAICILVGFMYRFASVFFFLAFTYIFLLDKSNYLNHFYLISLLSFINIFLPANRAFSLDAKLNPKSHSDWVPSWPLWWFRIQLGIVYLYGGIAKMNADWLNGEPMRMWLADRTDFPVIGSLFTEEWMVYLMSYSGMFLDLLVFPAMLWKRSRSIAFLFILSFHLMNSQLFSIGIFPWFMIAATMLYYPAERFRIGKKLDLKTAPTFSYNRVAFWGMGIYLFVQIVVPFRHWLYPGNVNWTEEGHRFSWHMKLRSKSSDINYYVVHEGDTMYVDLEDFLTPRQQRKVKCKPDMMLQFAHFLAEDTEENGLAGAQILMDCNCSLNGREYVPIVDSTRDYAQVYYPTFTAADWIIPLEEPLRREKGEAL